MVSVFSLSNRKRHVRYVLYWLIGFFLISFFSVSKDPYIDEIISIFCSINYRECLSWDVQTLNYYLFIKPVVLISGKIEHLRIFNAILVSLSLIIIIRSISLVRKLGFLHEFLILLSLSFLPVIYSSTLVRPYSLSLLLSSLSTYYFLKYMKKKDDNFLQKSATIDGIALLVFYFNIIIILPKILYLFVFRKKNFSETLKHIMKILLLPMIAFLSYVILINIQFKSVGVWISSTQHYENYKSYYFTFLGEFPLGLFKEQTALSIDYSSMLGKILGTFSQILFFIPILNFLYKKRKGESDEYEFVYITLFFFILLFNLTFSLSTSRFLVLSRQFVYISVPMLTFFSILLERSKKLYLLVFLPLTFIEPSIVRIYSLKKEGLLYFPLFELVQYVPENETVIVTPFYCTYYPWYYETFVASKGLKIYDILQEKIDWYKRSEEEKFTLRLWKTNVSHNKEILINEHIVLTKKEICNMTKIFIDFPEAKEYCKAIIKEIKTRTTYILICK